MNITLDDGPLAGDTLDIRSDAEQIVVAVKPYVVGDSTVLACRTGFYQLNGGSFTWKARRW